MLLNEEHQLLNLETTQVSFWLDTHFHLLNAVFAFGKGNEDFLNAPHTFVFSLIYVSCIVNKNVCVLQGIGANT